MMLRSAHLSSGSSSSLRQFNGGAIFPVVSDKTRIIAMLPSNSLACASYRREISGSLSDEAGIRFVELAGKGERQA
jgi:hypothetical protein